MQLRLSTLTSAFTLIAFAWANPDDGPQYYTDSIVTSGSTTYTARVPAASTPYFVSSTHSESTATFLSTSATTLYQTFTSFATYESESATTSYPTCSGTITVTTSIMIPYDYFRVVGTSFISEAVYETFYVSGTSTSEVLATSTTTYYVDGVHEYPTTTAPTDIHTAPFSLVFPCATTTVTQTLSYEPEIVTQVQLRQTYATLYYSSESYYTVSSTSYTTETYISTILIPYPVTRTTAGATASTTEIMIIITPQTYTSYLTYYETSASATTETFLITASLSGTTTVELGAVATGGSTFATSVISGNASVTTSTSTLVETIASQTTVLPAATGAASRILDSLKGSSLLVVIGLSILLLI